MYVFVTYAFPDMKGVQVKGIRVASNFPKEKVHFINYGDSEWLKSSGYNFTDFDFDAFYLPEQIKFPKNTECVIFCDLPTNHLGEVAIFLAAKEKKIPTVVMDNIYHHGQLNERVWKNIITYSDALLLNGLSFLDKNLPEKVKVFPPMIKKPGHYKEMREKIRIKYNISSNKKIVLSVGYNLHVLDNVKKIAKYFGKKDPHILVVVAAASDHPYQEENILYLPFQTEDEIRDLLYCSSLYICKFGYQQVIEALALKTPIIAVGGDQGFKRGWAEKEMLEALEYVPIVNQNTINHIQKTLSDPVYRDKILDKIKKLHNGVLNGAKIAADAIRSTKYTSPNIKKNIVVTLDNPANFKELEKFLQNSEFILPIILSIPCLYPMSQRVPRRNLYEFEMTPKNNILETSFDYIWRFSRHSVHASSLIFPWYFSLIENLSELLFSADSITIIGERTQILLKPLLEKNKITNYKVIKA